MSRCQPELPHATARQTEVVQERLDVFPKGCNLLLLEFDRGAFQGSHVAQVVAALDDQHRNRSVLHQALVVPFLWVFAQGLDHHADIRTEEMFQDILVDVRGIFQAVMHQACDDQVGIENSQFVDQDQGRCSKVFEVTNGNAIGIQFLPMLPAMRSLCHEVGNLHSSHFRRRKVRLQPSEEGCSVFKL